MTHIADRAASIPSFDVAGIDEVMLRRRLEAAYQSLADALDGGVPISVSNFESELDVLARDAVRSVALGHPMYATLETWREIARGRFAAASVGSARTSIAGAPTNAPPSLAARMSFFAQNSSSFRFAASLMPESEQLRVAGVYAWCRLTDDLVDHATDDDGADIETRLDEWLAASRAAYDGEATGMALLDDVMACTRDHGVPFDYAAELIAGMRMDLRHRDYADDAE